MICLSYLFVRGEGFAAPVVSAARRKRDRLNRLRYISKHLPSDRTVAY
jgi:hypothetical protein